MSPDFPGLLARAGWQLQAPIACWGAMAGAWDAWSAAAAGREHVARRAARRFDDIVQYARSRSRYYRDLYRALPGTAVAPRDVPPTTRGSLMERFDDWVTDGDVTRRSLSSFVADPGRVGQPYLGRYAAWTSSGTTGEPGLFVHDAQALAVYDALEMLRLGRGPLAPGFLGNLLVPGGRYAMVGATGGHFAGAVSIERMRALAPALADRIRMFSILEPLPRLIDALNAYRPTSLATYPTAASLFAAEQDAGRLALRLSTLWLGGETSTAPCRAQLRRAFRCDVLEEYGASECMSMACGCQRGRLHLNSDWALIEPVDRDYRPVAPAATSHTVLLTNLSNRVQPVIRCDLGDSVVLEADACDCGSPFPVLRVDGRSDEILHLRDRSGKEVSLLPLALTTVVEDFAGAHRFQIVQTAPAALSVRLEAANAREMTALWSAVERALRKYLETQGLPAVALTRDQAAPQRSARSGKLRRVLAWRGEAAARDGA